METNFTHLSELLLKVCCLNLEGLLDWAIFIRHGKTCLSLFKHLTLLKVWTRKKACMGMHSKLCRLKKVAQDTFRSHGGIISGLVGCWISNEAFLATVVARITSTDYLSSSLLASHSIPYQALTYHTRHNHTIPYHTRQCLEGTTISYHTIQRKTIPCHTIQGTTMQ